MLSHLNAMYAFYGEEQGVRMARKHIAWYLAPFNISLQAINQAESAQAQLHAVNFALAMKD
jgi:tRNA-dihydrouridine synthase B